VLSRRVFLASVGGLAMLAVRPACAASIDIEPWAAKLLAAAEAQVGVTTHYAPAYASMAYPNGDVPRDRGVCTDVVIRAYRDAFRCDLQRLVHEDMIANFSAYPKMWGLNRPDSNIDHRRVGNLQVFFRRHGQERPVTQNAGDYVPGDIYTCLLPGNLPHIGLVTAHKSSDGQRPLIVHNIGEGTQIEDRLLDYRLTGHYRYAPKV
jgi:uncharacterized protein